jgi:hypothetical protein
MASIDDEDEDYEEDEEEEEEDDGDDSNVSFHARQQGLTNQVVRSVMEQQQGAKTILGRAAKKGPEATMKRYGTTFSKWFPVVYDNTII